MRNFTQSDKKMHDCCLHPQIISLMSHLKNEFVISLQGQSHEKGWWVKGMGRYSSLGPNKEQLRGFKFFWSAIQS
jgi:hypothetical protein